MNTHVFAGSRVWTSVFIVMAFIICAVVYSKMPVIDTSTPFLDAHVVTLIAWPVTFFYTAFVAQLLFPVKNEMKILFTMFSVVVYVLGIIFVVDASRMSAANIPVAAFLFIVGVVLVALFVLLPTFGGLYAANRQTANVEY